MTNSDRPAILGGSPVRAGGPPAWPRVDPAITTVFEELGRTGDWGRYRGPHCDALIEQIKGFQHTNHVHLCASGTAAVELALRGLPVEPGDEVILSAYDFKGNIQDVLALGAVPVLVDVRRDDWQIAVGRIEEAMTAKTRAIVVSHLHGGGVDMPEVMRIARTHDVGVVEDACQAQGAQVAGRLAGNWGDVGVWSFGGSKLLTAGRGGALFTNDDAIAQRIRLFVERGNSAYPLSEMQAAVLRPQVDGLAARNERRLQAIDRLLNAWPWDEGLRPFQLTLRDSSRGTYKLGFQYRMESFAGLTRDQFAAAVRAEGVALDPGFRAVHRTHSKRRFRAGDLLVADEADEGVLVLHHPVLLGTDADIEQVRAAIEKVAAFAEEISQAGS